MKAVIFLSFIFSLLFSQSADAQMKRVKYFKEDPKQEFQIVGSFEVENPYSEALSIDEFRLAYKRKGVYGFFNRKINDENFAETVPSGAKVRMYVVRHKKNAPFTESQALAFIEENGGELPSVPWALLAIEQRGSKAWKQNTVIFTEKAIKHKEGWNLIPFITPDNDLHLYAREFPNEFCDFIFIVDENKNSKTVAENQ
jgi:hypothetical protein